MHPLARLAPTLLVLTQLAHAGRVNVPETKLSLIYEGEMELMELDQGEDPMKLPGVTRMRDYGFADDRGVFGTITIFEVDEAGIALTWLHGSFAKEMLADMAKSEAGMQTDVNRFDEMRFGGRLGYQFTLNTEVEEEGEKVKLSFDATFIGGQKQLLMVHTFADADDKDAIKAQQSITESLVYNSDMAGKRRSILPSFLNWQKAQKD